MKVARGGEAGRSCGGRSGLERDDRASEPLHERPELVGLETAVQPEDGGLPLVERLRERAPTEAMLLVPDGPAFRATLEAGESRTFTAVLRGGVCYKVLGGAAESVTDLDVLVYDPNNVLSQRDTFIIDPEGRIAKHYVKVDPKAHSEAVLADLKQLMAGAAKKS